MRTLYGQDYIKPVVSKARMTWRSNVGWVEAEPTWSRFEGVPADGTELFYEKAIPYGTEYVPVPDLMVGEVYESRGRTLMLNHNDYPTPRSWVYTTHRDFEIKYYVLDGKVFSRQAAEDYVSEQLGCDKYEAYHYLRSLPRAEHNSLRSHEVMYWAPLL